MIRAAARERELDQRQRREHVDAVDVLERVQRVVGERAAAGSARAPTALLTSRSIGPGGGDQRRAVLGVGDVAGERGDVGAARVRRRPRSAGPARGRR